MCRLLYIKSDKTFSISDHLGPFAKIARNSKEYQGHGWGCAYLRNGKWEHYKNISPVWEDHFEQFGSTTLLLAHARSAFRDRDIRIENNMPFISGKYVFIFNGELHGVRIREEGRIGAEKIFNFILRLNTGSMGAALERSMQVIEKRSRYIRALNCIIADSQSAFLATSFNEDDDYFTMHMKQTSSSLIVCSEPYPGETSWNPIANKTIRKLT